MQAKHLPDVTWTIVCKAAGTTAHVEDPPGSIVRPEHRGSLQDASCRSHGHQSAQRRCPLIAMILLWITKRTNPKFSTTGLMKVKCAPERRLIEAPLLGRYQLPTRMTNPGTALRWQQQRISSSPNFSISLPQIYHTTGTVPDAQTRSESALSQN